MRKEQISTSQAYIMIIILIIGSSLSVTSYSEDKQNTWISVLIALALATPIIILYGVIMNCNPGKDIFQILESSFGKIPGKIISILYAFYFFHIGALVTRNITEYIQVVSFPETPQYFTALFLCILSIYVLKSGFEVLARLSKFLFPLLVCILFVTFILAIPKANFRNLLPIAEDGWLSVIRSSFLPFSYPFAETIVFLGFLDKIVDKKKTLKVLLFGIYGGGFFLFNVVLRNILLLGLPTLSSSTFTSYHAVSLINIGQFIRGIEITVPIITVISGFIKVSTCLFAASIGFCRVFNFSDYKKVCAPLSLLMTTLSFILFRSTMHMIEWAHVYKYYAFPFQVILPIIILIISLVKKNRKTNITNSSKP